MTRMTVPGSNLPISFFSVSLCMSSSQPKKKIPNTHIHTTNMDLNLAWRTHFHALLIFWGDGHDLAYFVNDQSKSKVLGHLTAQHVILISTSEFRNFLVAL